MNPVNSPVRAALLVAVIACGILAAPICSFAQQEEPVNAQPHMPISGVDDWTHHALIYSNPAQADSATFERIGNEPRYILQQLKRGQPAQGPGAQALAAFEQSVATGGQKPVVRRLPNGRAQLQSNGEAPRLPLERDWNASLGAAGVAPYMFPDKFTSDIYGGTPDCSLDYAVFPVDTAGVSGSQANIVGFHNLYVNSSGTGYCAGTAPTVMFSYYVGTGIVQTSIGSTLDGTKLLFVESKAGASRLHVLQIGTTGNNGSSATAPVAPGSGNNAVDTAVPLSGNVMVTRSSVDYDYGTDSAYVGDDAGVLHRFHPVFSGMLTEVTSGGWPITVAAGSILSAPTLEPNSQNIFLGDAKNGELWYVRNTGSTTGICYGGGAPPCLGGYVSGSNTYAGIPVGNGTANKTYGGIVDPPIVDGTTGTVFAASGSGVSAYCSNDGAVLVETSLSFANGTVEYQCLGKGDVDNLHFGTWDNAYFSNPGNGHLWWEGNDTVTGQPVIWIIGFNSSGIMTSGTATEFSQAPLAAAPEEGSQVVTLYDPFFGTEWLTGSVPNESCGGAANGGCVIAFNITNGASSTILGPWLPGTNYSLGEEIVDTNANVQMVTTAGVSNTTPPAPWNTTGTTTDGANAFASGSGTFSANTATGGQYATINGTEIIASAPTAATATGTFTAAPSASPAITIKDGANTLSLATNATTASAIGTFTALPTSVSAPTLTLTDSSSGTANTLSLTTNATGATGTGTFTADLAPLTSGIKITNGANSVTFVPSASTPASVKGTFASDPTSGMVQITNGANSETLAVSPGSAASGSGTFTGSPTDGIVTITNGANVLTLGANAGLRASATGTFTSPDPSTPSQTVTITNGANAMTLTVSPGTAASATGTFTGNPSNMQTVTVTSGSYVDQVTASASTAACVTGTFSGAGPANGSAFTIINENTDTGMSLTASTTMNSGIYFENDGVPTDMATNLAAAINRNNNANIGVTASSSGAVVTVCAVTAGTAGNNIAVEADNSNPTYATGTVTTTCADGTTQGDTLTVGSQAYTFEPVPVASNCPSGDACVYYGDSAANESADIEAAINDNGTECEASYPSTCFANISAANGSAAASYTAGNTFTTVTALVPGTVGNSIAFSAVSSCLTLAPATGTLSGGSGAAASGFAWSSGNLSGGTTGTNGGSDFLVDGVPADDATNLAAALNRNVGSVPVVASSSGANVTITALQRGASVNGTITVASAATGFSWSGSSVAGGVNGTNTGSSFFTDGIPADDAANLAAAVTRNSSTNVPVTGSSSGSVTTVTATQYGPAGNTIALGGTAAGNGFAWSGSGLTGGSGTNTGTLFVTDGNVTDNATNLAAAIARNGSATVPVTATSSGATVNVASTTRGTSANNISLATYTGSTYATGTVTSCGVGPAQNDTLTIGGTTYYFSASQAACPSNKTPCIYFSLTAAGVATDIQAAINDDGLQCESGYTNNCFWNITAPNASASATNVAGNPSDTVTALQEGASGNSIALSTVSSCITVSPTTGDLAGGSNGTEANLTGFGWNNSDPVNLSGGASGANTTTTFATDGILTDDANNLMTAINLNTGTVGVSATASGAVVTAVASVGGSGGNSIVVGPATLPAGFTWSCGTAPCDMSGGANGNSTPPDFAEDTVPADDATNLAADINHYSATLGVTATPNVPSAGKVSVAANSLGIGGNSIALALSGGTPQTGTATFDNPNNNGTYNGDAVKVATLTYTFEDTQADCPNTTAPCVFWGWVNSDAAQALEAALNNNPAQCPTDTTGTWGSTCYSYVTAANPSATASWVSTNNTVVTVTNTSAAAITFTYTRNPLGITTITLSPNGSIGAPGAPTGYSWSGATMTGGSNGTNTCTSPGAGSITGTFALATNNTTAPTTTTVAGQVAAAVTACNTAFPAANFSTSTSTNTVTVTDKTPGPFLAVGDSNNTGLFSWGAVTGGAAGSNGCTGNTTATFATSSNTTTLAGNFAAAISACPSSTTVGVTAASSNNVVTLTAATPGSTGNTIALGGVPAGFTWSGADLTGGSDGSATGPDFPYWSGAARVSLTTLAGNFAAAVNRTFPGMLTAGNTTGTVNLTASNCGPQYDYSLGNGTLGSFAWTGTAMTGGKCAVVWTAEGASNGEATAAQATGTSGPVIDNIFFPAWQASHAYSTGATISDSNGYAQKVTTGGTSGATAPTWNTTDGGTTADGSVTWTNVGQLPTANVYVGTLNGAQGDKAVKYTQKGLQ